MWFYKLIFFLPFFQLTFICCNGQETLQNRLAIIDDFKQNVKKKEQTLQFTIQNEVSNAGNIGGLKLENKKWALQSNWKFSYKSNPGYSIKTAVGKYIGPKQKLMSYLAHQYSYQSNERGYNIFGQKIHKQAINDLLVGTTSTLPFLIIFDANVSLINGNITMSLNKNDIQIFSKLKADLLIDNSLGFNVRMRYIFTPYFMLSAFYDSGMTWGTGLILKY